MTFREATSTPFEASISLYRIILFIYPPRLTQGDIDKPIRVRYTQRARSQHLVIFFRSAVGRGRGTRRRTHQTRVLPVRDRPHRDGDSLLTDRCACHRVALPVGMTLVLLQRRGRQRRSVNPSGQTKLLGGRFPLFPDSDQGCFHKEINRFRRSTDSPASTSDTQVSFLSVLMQRRTRCLLGGGGEPPTSEGRGQSAWSGGRELRGDTTPSTRAFATITLKQLSLGSLDALRRRVTESMRHPIQ